MEEIWKIIPGYDGSYIQGYYASSLGRIKSVHNNGKVCILSPCVHKKGYLTLNIRREGKTVKRFVHNLVCLAFYGPRPEGVKEINHKDGIKTNNVYTNLEYSTSGDNQKHAYKQGLRIRPKGVKNPQSRLSTDDVLAIYRQSQDGVSNQILAKTYKVHEAHIRAICNGRRWNHITKIREEVML